MSPILLEAILILLLILANGILSMSEMAIVTSRRARLQHRADRGSTAARAALDLASAPDRFLSTVQIGITTVGILAGAFGGATIAEQLGVYFARFPTLAQYGEVLGLAIVVIGITILSLVLGELVPKRLALNNPEKIAERVARPMRLLSTLVSPAARTLSLATNGVLKVLRVRPPSEPRVSEDEIRVMLAEATDAGVLHEAEQEIVEGVLRFGDQSVGAMMTRRQRMEWLDLQKGEESCFAEILEIEATAVPVCDGSLDVVVGILNLREALAARLRDPAASLRSLLTAPRFVPETAPAIGMLELFGVEGVELLLVTDEHGAVQGVFSTTDLIRAFLGGVLSDFVHDEPGITQRDDGSWLVDGSVPIDLFLEEFGLGDEPPPARGEMLTVAGLVLAALGRVPEIADTFSWGGFRFEVVDMDGWRIDKVLVTRE